MSVGKVFPRISLHQDRRWTKKRGIEKPFVAKEKPCRVKEKLWATGQEIDGTQNLWQNRKTEIKGLWNKQWDWQTEVRSGHTVNTLTPYSD